jgi:hypothetical protein
MLFRPDEPARPAPRTRAQIAAELRFSIAAVEADRWDPFDELRLKYLARARERLGRLEAATPGKGCQNSDNLFPLAIPRPREEPTLGPTAIDPVTLTVRVDDDHIAGGCRHDPGTCPIARAVAELLASGFTVGVTHARIAVYDSRGLLAATCPLPAWVGDFISRFDNTGDGDPFEFPITLPAAVLAPAPTMATAHA